MQSKSIEKREADVLTVEEARLRLGLGRNSMYDALTRREIPSLRIGRRILIPKAAFEHWLQTRPLAQ